MEQMQILSKRPIQKPSRSVITIVIAVVIVSITLFHFLVPSNTLTYSPSPSRWEAYPHNPVLPDPTHTEEMGTMFDLSILHEDGVYRMYGSWRPNGSISYSTSRDGFVWDQNLRGSLGGEGAHHWEPIVNRPFVLKRATGEYLMWYTGQVGGGQNMGGQLGMAKSHDGIQFTRLVNHNPVMTADLPWERYDAVMTPCVVELPNDVLRMYYSAGEWYEPDAIGVAHSYDGGMTWVKHGNPVFYPDPTSGHDNYKVTSPHVLFHEGWYYLFYCGFRDVDHATVNLARSRDGLTRWEASVENPIVAPNPEPNSWNCDATYKPFAMYDEASQQWLLWYNGRCEHLERIGMATLKGDFGRFVERAGPAEVLWF